jgi:hypothetical protein
MTGEHRKPVAILSVQKATANQPSVTTYSFADSSSAIADIWCSTKIWQEWSGYLSLSENGTGTASPCVKLLIRASYSLKSPTHTACIGDFLWMKNLF